jgi:hypothetical protein
MARPSPEERKKLDARRAEKAKLRGDKDARDAAVHVRVQGIIDQSLKRSRGALALPDIEELVARLEEARALAMATSQPGHAVAAVMAQAKLLGLVVEMQAVGRPEEIRALQGDVAEQQQALIERLREKHGSRAAEKFARFIEYMKRDDDNDVIDGEPGPPPH